MLTLKQPEQGLSEHKPETLLGAPETISGVQAVKAIVLLILGCC